SSTSSPSLTIQTRYVCHSPGFSTSTVVRSYVAEPVPGSRYQVLNRLTESPTYSRMSVSGGQTGHTPVVQNAGQTPNPVSVRNSPSMSYSGNRSSTTICCLAWMAPDRYQSGACGSCVLRPSGADSRSAVNVSTPWSMET